MNSLPVIHEIPSVYNLRDIGGYPCSGGTVAAGRFFRSAAFDRIDSDGVAALAEKGVCLVVDLRSTREREMMPDFPNGHPFQYQHLPMLDHIQSNFAEGDFSIFPARLSDMYCSLLKDSADTFREVFESLAACRGAAVVHCTAGKDRTGLATMLLLDLAGVDRDTILYDYSLSEKLLPGGPLIDEHPELPRFLFESKPETMDEALAFLQREFGCAADYLRAAGVAADAIAALRKRLLGE